MSEQFDQEVRHSLYIQKRATGIVNSDVIPSLAAMERKIREILTRDEFEYLGRRDFNAMIKAVQEVVNTELSGMWSVVVNDLTELGIYEAEYQAEFIEEISGEVVAIPKDDALKTYAASQIITLDGKPPFAGKYSELIKKYSVSTQESITNTIKYGYDTGLTNSQVVQQIRGTKKNNYQDGIIAVNTRNANTIVRTGMSHYINSSKELLAKENKDILSGKLFVATLDSGTTLICRSNANEVWDIDDKSAPRLPLHYNERSTWLLVVKGIDPLVGSRASKGADGGKQIAADTTQDEFLKRQPKWFVEKSLNAKWRADLFDEGLSVKDFVNKSTGMPFTLDELKRSDKEAIQKAIKAAKL